MKTLLTLAAALMLAGCGVFKTYVQNDAQAQMERDSAERQARLKAEGKLNAKELEAVSAHGVGAGGGEWPPSGSIH